MIVFLKKARVKTVFSLVDPSLVEPLELSYLYSLVENLGLRPFILDEFFPSSLDKVKGLVPDLLVLSGYNVAENKILEEAKYYKSLYPMVKVIVGGVHIELNSKDFHTDYVDYVIHTNNTRAFENLLRSFRGESVNLDGIDINNKGKWQIGKKLILDEIPTLLPSRDFFYEHKEKFYYLDKKNLALIKGSTGCPYVCSYCYCRLINSRKYLKADYGSIIEQMNKLDADYYWIVDDSFFINRDDALNFLQAAKEVNFRKKFIAYLRADFLLEASDLIGQLQDHGLNEVIVGFEAVSEEEILSYKKGTNALDYPKIISILREHSLDYTALFMVQRDYGLGDFKKLYKFIKDNKIEVFTLSIHTPIKGSEEYEREKDSLTTNDPLKFDFLHLVAKPKLAKTVFYLAFYFIYLQMFKSKRIRNFLLRRK